MQLVQLALQVGSTAFQFFVVATGGVQLFLGHRQFVAQGLAIARLALGALLRIGRDQAQVVLGIGARRRIACLGAPGGIQLLLARGLIARRTAPLAPGEVLRRHFGDRLGLRECRALYRVRQAQYLAGFQAVDIAVDKGVGVQCLDGQHRLLYRTAIVVLLGNFPQGVVGGSRMLGGLAHGGRRIGRRTQARRGGCWGCRGCGWRLLVELGRVEQHAVVAHEATIGPLHLQQEAHIGVRQRLAGGDTHHTAAVGIDHRRERQVVEECLAIDAGIHERLG